MRHSIEWDIKDANEMCLSCDNCNSAVCGYINKNTRPAGAVAYGQKIYLCPNFACKGEVIDDYDAYRSEAYHELVETIRSQKAEIFKLRKKVTVARKFAKAFDDFKETFKDWRLKD